MEKGDLELLVLTVDNYLSTKDVREIDFIIPSSTTLLDAESSIIYHSSEYILGISMSFIKPLYLYAYTTYMQVLRRSKECCLLRPPRELVDRILSITKVLLVLKGDFPLAYNSRKRILLENPEMISAEMQFTWAVFSKHPKSPSGWEHRRWCLLRRSSQKSGGCLSDNILNPMEIETERHLCRLSAERYPKNYYAWLHRLWLFRHQSIPLSTLEDEWLFTTQWLLDHVSDHSAVNHRIQIALLVLEKSRSFQGRNSSLDFAVKQSLRFLEYRPGSESLWAHCRQCILLILADLHMGKNGLQCMDKEDFNKLQASIFDIINGSKDEQSEESSPGWDELPDKDWESETDAKPYSSTLMWQFIVDVIKRVSIWIRNDSPCLWNGDKQRILAIRFIAFIAQRVVVAFGNRVEIGKEVACFRKLFNWSHSISQGVRQAGILSYEAIHSIEYSNTNI